MRIFVYAPEDFNNLCVLTRILDALGVAACSVYDPHRLVRPRYGKSYRRKLKTVSAGAFFRIAFERVAEPIQFLDSYAGRTIATVTDQSDASLYEFGFGEDDMMVFGSESHGLPFEVAEACDARLTIPQRGATQSLNLSVASGIILSEWFRQIDGCHRNGSPRTRAARGPQMRYTDSEDPAQTKGCGDDG